MKISCIIPTKNRCQMVLEAIESVKHQYVSGLEIIVVDDGSTDNTLVDITSKFPDVQTIRLHGIGPGPARNAGVAVSSGDILMFLDSDDIWIDNHVQILMDVFTRGFQVAYGTSKTIDEVGGAEFFIPEHGNGLEGDCFDALLRWCFMVPSAMAIKREAFEEVGGFDDEPYGEDWNFFLKLSSRIPFGFAGPEPITLRKLHRGSLCFLSDKKKLLAIINQVLTFLENEPRATAVQKKHFKMLYDWTANNYARWNTVQDWYKSMLKEKII